MRGKVARELRQMVNSLFPERPWKVLVKQERSMQVAEDVIGLGSYGVELDKDCRKAIYKQVKKNFRGQNSAGIN